MNEQQRISIAHQAAAALAAITNTQHGAPTTEHVGCAEYHGEAFVEDSRMPTVYNGVWHCDFILNDDGIRIEFCGEESHESTVCHSLNVLDVLGCAMALGTAQDADL
jgi:hypothetical protein